MSTMLVVRSKRALKYFLIAVGGKRLVVWYWRLRGKQVSHLASGSRDEVFRQIYDQGVWVVDDETAPLSGSGSALTATDQLRAALPALIADLNIKTLSDIGCGDFTWMAHTALDVDHYLGFDIVPSVIAANVARYAAPSRSFAVLDVCEVVPSTADAALCREVLFHLSYSDALQALKNIRLSGTRFLLASSDPMVSENSDILSGDFRDINLSIAPYNLGDPIRQIAEAEGPNPNRILGVWAIN